jgi:hypothetical protein
VVTSLICRSEIHLAITGAFVSVERKMHKICSSLECALAKEEKIWAGQSCCGYWVYRFRSSFCSLCSGIDGPEERQRQ